MTWPIRAPRRDRETLKVLVTMAVVGAGGHRRAWGSGSVVEKLQLVPPLAFELLGTPKSWQSPICHQWDPSQSGGMGPGTSSAQCHRGWKWPNLLREGEGGWSSCAGRCRGKLSSSDSLNTCNYV